MAYVPDDPLMASRHIRSGLSALIDRHLNLPLGWRNWATEGEGGYYIGRHQMLAQTPYRGETPIRTYLRALTPSIM